MKIVGVDYKHDDKIILRSSVTKPEYEQLNGNLAKICLFATNDITETASVTLTGARNSRAKWLLLPIKTRMKYDRNKFDYDNVSCGCVEKGNDVFFIYKVGKKDGVKP